MIPTSKLKTALLPLSPLRLVGLTGRMSVRSTCSAVLFALSILAVSFWVPKSDFFLQDVCQTAALLYSLARNLLNSADFLAVMDIVQELEERHTHRYKFRWSVLVSALQIMITATICGINGFVPADAILFVYILKHDGILTLVHVLRCQSALLDNTSNLEDYHRVRRGLRSLRSYLAPEMYFFCFFCFLSSSNCSYMAVIAMVRAFAFPDEGPQALYCICYWTGFFVSVCSLLALVEAYSCIEEKKEEFEDRLYWSLVSAPPFGKRKISERYKMLFEISSKEKEEEKLRIDYKLIYSVVTASFTFMVLLLQFGLEYIICDEHHKKI